MTTDLPYKALMMRILLLPELPPQLSNRTPAGRALSLPADDDRPTIQSTNDANTSAKRRKLEGDGAPAASTRSRRSMSLHAPANDIYAIPPDIEEESIVPEIANGLMVEPQAGKEAELEVSSGSIEDQTQNDARDTSVERPVVGKTALESALPISTPRGLTPSPDQGAEEVTESPNDAPGSGHRKRIGFSAATAQSSRLQDLLQKRDTPEAQPIDNIENGSPQKKRKRGEVARKDKSTEPAAKRSRRNVVNDPAADEPDELSPGPHISQKSRSTVSGQVEEETDELSPDPQLRRSRRSKSTMEEESLLAEDNINEDSMEVANEIDDLEAATVLENNRGRRRSINKPREASIDLDEVTEGIPQPLKKKKQRQISTPAKQSQPKKPAKKSIVRHSSPIPITVHRLSERMYYDDGNTDNDILNVDIPYAKKSGVNAIDVFSQASSEVVNKMLDTLTQGIESTNEKVVRKEYKRKWQVIDAFGKELQARLVEHVSHFDFA